MCVYPINMPQGSPSLSHLKFLEDDDKVLGTDTDTNTQTRTHFSSLLENQILCQENELML